jgi:methylamine dehydrogenase heavy chain
VHKATLFGAEPRDCRRWRLTEVGRLSNLRAVVRVLAAKEGLGPMKLSYRKILSCSLGALMLGAPVMAAPALAATVEPEEALVKTLPPTSPDWFFIRGGFNTDGTPIHDANSGKMVGLIDTSRRSDMAFDPLGKVYYVAETIWSKGNRGTRQDLLSVYDATTLKLQTEITLPGRLIIGAQPNNFAVSEDGKTGYVYNLTPAASVNIVDLVKRKFVKAIDLPGCAGLMPIDGGLVSVCSDGSLATLDVAGGKGEVKRSAPFFAATSDPVFDSFNYSLPAKEAVFLSYTGQIYTAKIGTTSSVSAPFSIQQAAGLRAGDTKPLDISWFPGGYQPSAWHRASGHLYVLMHVGEYWSQKQPATEIWDVDLAAKKVVKRFTLEQPVMNIGVTQTAKPKIMVTGFKGTGFVIDPASWTQTAKIEHAGGGIIQTVEPK